MAERSSFAFLFHLARFGAALRLTIRSPFFSLAAVCHELCQRKSKVEKTAVEGGTHRRAKQPWREEEQAPRRKLLQQAEEQSTWSSDQI